jgi:transposase
VVLDNAPIHHSDEFQEQIAIWEEQDIYIFFLPTYSPHRNRAAFRIIERLWLKTKYEWLKPHHYESFEILTKAVEETLNQVGLKLTLEKSNILQNSKRRLNLNDYLSFKLLRC